MEAALARHPMNHFSGSIPPDIYQPLLEIAQRGYDADDVMHWYIDLKRNLSRIDTPNLPVSYSLTPPFSVCSPAPHDSNASLFNNEGSTTSPLDSSVDPQKLYNIAQRSASLWSEVSSYNTSDPTQTSVTTPVSLPPHVTDERSITHGFPSWSCEATTFAGSELPVARVDPENLTNNSTTSLPWFHTVNYEPVQETSTRRNTSQSYDHPLAIGNPPLPMFVGPEPSPFAPGMAFSEIAYLPPISIVPSRKRRKTKGVQKFIQPLRLRRQSEK